MFWVRAAVKAFATMPKVLVNAVQTGSLSDTNHNRWILIAERFSWLKYSDGGLDDNIPDH
jgi:hypothetical protein